MYSAIMRRRKILVNRLTYLQRLVGEIFADFGFKSKDTKLERKYW